MYAPVKELARARVRLDLAKQHRIVVEDSSGVLGRVDCLLRHLLTLGEIMLAGEELLQEKDSIALMSGPSNGYPRTGRHSYADVRTHHVVDQCVCVLDYHDPAVIPLNEADICGLADTALAFISAREALSEDVEQLLSILQAEPAGSSSAFLPLQAAGTSCNTSTIVRMTMHLGVWLCSHGL